MEILIKRRTRDSFDPTENVLMEFDSINEAINWMEEENENEFRSHDIASVGFPH